MAVKVVSVMNLKGGVGKSTIAMILSEYLAFKFLKRVLVIDFDSQANLTSAMVKPLYSHQNLRDAGRTIYHLFKAFLAGQKRPITDFVCPSQLADGVSNVWRGQPGIRLDMVISIPDLAGLDEDLIDLWENDKPIPQGIRYALAEALVPVLDEYDCILIDCPPGLSLFTSSAIVASDYYVSPVIPEPLSLSGLELIGHRIAELRRRDPGLKIQHAGSILSKVLHYRKAHAVEAALMSGVSIGGRRPYPSGLYSPFTFWVPDAEWLRKLGDFDLSLFEGTATTPDRRWVHGKYGGNWVKLANAVGKAGLDSSTQDGVEYLLSNRLERLTREFMDRVGIPV